MSNRLLQAPLNLSDSQEEQLVHGKLEGLAWQYNTLLASQLDEQRAFYQKQMGRLVEEQVRSVGPLSTVSATRRGSHSVHYNTFLLTANWTTASTLSHDNELSHRGADA